MRRQKKFGVKKMGVRILRSKNAAVSTDTSAVIEPPALRLLFDQIYAELKRKAHLVRRHSGLLTLNTTGLVHETVIKLIEAQARVLDRAHLLNLAARAMRQVLFNHLEAASMQKRGGGLKRVELDDATPENSDLESTANVLSAMNRLQHVDQRLADIFVLRAFGGFGYVDIARMLAVSHTTIQRDYERARAFLLSLHQDSALPTAPCAT
jgi:RNA polymerase sigma factor (TIGR02999 family)